MGLGKYPWDWDWLISHGQGPKLTFLGRRQEATEIFFSVAIWKNVVAKKQKKSANKIFPSQRNTNQNFWLPNGKFASAFEAAMAIYTPSTEKPRRINRMPAIYAVS